MQLLFKYDLVKYDMEKDEPVKDQWGFCQRVNRGKSYFQKFPPIKVVFRIGLCLKCLNSDSWFLFSGETGLLLSKISATSPFFGYAGSKQLTEHKLMRNVFRKADAYFNTGDLMTENHEGFICFTDRVGDTFRYSKSSS